MTVSERLCRLAPSTLRSGDSLRELGGDVAEVASSDAQFSDVKELEAVKDSVLMSRTKAGILILVGKAAMVVKRKDVKGR